MWTRAELLDAVWNIHFDPETNVVNVHIARLRRKLDRQGSPLIHTVRGEGYVFALEPPPETVRDTAGESALDADAGEVPPRASEPRGEKPRTDKSRTDKSRAEKPRAEKPRTEKPHGDDPPRTRDTSA